MTAYVGQSGIAGSGVFSSQDVDAGGLVLSRDRPTFATLDTQRLPETCSTCFTWNPKSPDQLGHSSGNVSMKICTGCRTLRYCSKQCQAKSWPEHRKECKFLGQLSAKGALPNAARLVVQMLTTFLSTKVAILQHLQSHLPEIAAAGGQRFETLEFLSMGLHEYTGKTADINFFKRGFALIYTNALTVNSSTFDPLGICVDEVAAKINHSCSPNTYMVFDGLHLTLRALRPIAKDEEVFISYIENTNPFNVRRTELLDRYYFTCACEKCVHGPTLDEDKFLKSPAPDDIKDKEVLVLSKLNDAKTEMDPLGALKHLDEALETCLNTRIWPERRQPIPTIRQETFVTLLSGDLWVRAFRQGFKIYFEIQPLLYPEPFHPLRVVQKWTLAKLALLLSDQQGSDSFKPLDQAGLDLGVIILGLLTEVLDNVRLSHGSDHSFAHTVKAKHEEVIVDMTRGDDKHLQSMKDKTQVQWEALRRFASSEET